MDLPIKRLRMKTITIIILVITFTVSCSYHRITATVSVSTQTRTTTPEPSHTQTPTSTLPPTSTITPSPSITSTPQPTNTSTSTPTMTHFPTLDYVVEYPFNPHYLSYAPIEEVQYSMLSWFIVFIEQEKDYYEAYGIPRNPDLLGFPDMLHRDFWGSLLLPTFCRYYPYARLIHMSELTPQNLGSFDYTFVEAQTLVGVDCADVDISMFPAPKNKSFP